jgi:hypothetical protein
MCTYSFFIFLCVLNLMLPACGSNFADVARMTWKVDQACVRPIREQWGEGFWTEPNKHVCGILMQLHVYFVSWAGAIC